MTQDKPAPSLPDAMAIPLEDAISQLLCFGWQGDGCDGVNDHARELVEDMRVGGIILLARNVSSPEAVRLALKELQDRAAIPLLIAVDQEGGRVNRFGPPFTQFPGNMALGACGEDAPSLAEQQALAQARELRSVGVNWNLAPVLDVNNNPANPVIGIRSYGADPDLVGRLGTAAIAGYRDGGVLACAKHFPGHGNTAVDSHLGLPVVDASRSGLDAVELVPFRRAIEAGVPSIMTTHIVFPALDYCQPATVSASILTDLLRNELGYDGVIITDCLEMAAIAETIGTPHGAVAALMAGADMALVSHTLDTQRETVRAIRQAVYGGILDEARIRQAAARVLCMKAAWLNTFFDVPSGVDWAMHQALETRIARASVTALRGGSALPLRSGACVTVVAADAGCKAVSDYLRQAGVQATWRLLDAESAGDHVTDTLAQLLNSDAAVALVGSEPAASAEAASRFVHRAIELMGERLIVAAVRSPYDLGAYPDAPVALCTYGARDCSLQALADALAGRFTPTGRLPVSVPGL